MKKLFLFFSLCFFLSTQSIAQYGLHAGVTRMNAKKWQAFYPNSDFLNGGYKIGVDYWFRLKKRRVEFTPELSFQNFSTTILSTNQEFGKEFTAQFYSFQFNTNFYLLNFEEDCNCPTFGKDGGILDKGFFIQVSPVVSYMRNKYVAENEEASTNSVIFGIGGGLGLDIGLNKFLTLTPYANLHYFFDAEWEGLDTLTITDGQAPPEDSSNSTSITQFTFGLKLGIRFDEINKYGFR